jgi:hypothetical protein
MEEEEAQGGGGGLTISTASTPPSPPPVRSREVIAELPQPSDEHLPLAADEHQPRRAFDIPLVHTFPFTSLSTLTVKPKMVEGRGSTLVHLIVLVLCLVAFGFSIAAERRRSTGTIQIDERTNSTYCVYNSDVAAGYGVGGFLFLLTGESLLMGVTKCMCFGRPLLPGSNRAWTIIYFVLSW